MSFNIAFARNLDAAIALLATHPALRGADVVLLQEMTGEAARRVARALDLHWVYYPAIHHTRARQDFGNAVLSRWPIVEDARLVLPHPSRYAGTQRTATAATILVGDTPVRVYSTHLGTPLDVGARGRRAQLRAILAGSAGPPARGPRTTRFGRWDHVFLRGLASPAGDAAGTVVREARGISDHVPVWARAVLR